MSVDLRTRAVRWFKLFTSWIMTYGIGTREPRIGVWLVPRRHAVCCCNLKAVWLRAACLDVFRMHAFFRKSGRVEMRVGAIPRLAAGVAATFWCARSKSCPLNDCPYKSNTSYRFALHTFSFRVRHLHF